MNLNKNVSLRENADTTRQASAPAVETNVYNALGLEVQTVVPTHNWNVLFDAAGGADIDF